LGLKVLLSGEKTNVGAFNGDEASFASTCTGKSRRFKARILRQILFIHNLSGFNIKTLDILEALEEVQVF